MDAKNLEIYLQLNGERVGIAWTSPGASGSEHAVSLSASLRLAKGDKVNLMNIGGGGLFDDYRHWTHFTGWLVEEELM